MSSPPILIQNCLDDLVRICDRNSLCQNMRSVNALLFPFSHGKSRKTVDFIYIDVMKLHFTFFYLSMILDNQEACITDFSSLMTMCCITVASGYSLVKDADKCLWKIQRAMEDPYRGQLE